MIAVCLLFAVLSSAQVPILPEQYTALQQFMIAGLGRVLQLNTSACPPNLSPPNGRVACDTKGRITQLYLNRANLQGNFSDAISRLTDLTYLNLSDNMLVSGVWNLAPLTNLETLDLSYNAMIGDVLSVVENLPYLRSCVLQIPSPRDTNCFSGRLEANATVCNDARLSPLNLCRTYIERVTVITSPTTSAKPTTTFYTGPRSTSSSNVPTTTTTTTTTVSTTLRTTTTTTTTTSAVVTMKTAAMTTTQTTKPAVPSSTVSATTVVGQFSLMSEQRTGNLPSTSTDSGTLAPSPTVQPTSTTDQFSTTTTTTSAAESQTTVSAIPSVSIAVSATTATDQHLAVVILGVVVAVLYVSIVLYVVVSKLRKRRTLARMNSLNTGPFQLASELLDVADIASQDGGDGSSTADENAPSPGSGGKGASRAEPIYDRVFSDGAGGFKTPGAASQNGEYDNLGVVSSQVPRAVSPTLRHRAGAAAAAAAVAASSSALPPPMLAAYSQLPPPITDRVDSSTGDGGSYARVKTKVVGNYSLVKVDSAKTVYDDVEAPFN